VRRGLRCVLSWKSLITARCTRSLNETGWNIDPMARLDRGGLSCYKTATLGRFTTGIHSNTPFSSPNHATNCRNWPSHPCPTSKKRPDVLCWPCFQGWSQRANGSHPHSKHGRKRYYSRIHHPWRWSWPNSSCSDQGLAGFRNRLLCFGSHRVGGRWDCLRSFGRSRPRCLGARGRHHGLTCSSR